MSVFLFFRQITVICRSNEKSTRLYFIPENNQATVTSEIQLRCHKCFVQFIVALYAMLYVQLRITIEEIDCHAHDHCNQNISRSLLNKYLCLEV